MLKEFHECKCRELRNGKCPNLMEFAEGEKYYCEIVGKELPKKFAKYTHCLEAQSPPSTAKFEEQLKGEFEKNRQALYRKEMQTLKHNVIDEREV